MLNNLTSLTPPKAFSCHSYEDMYKLSAANQGRIASSFHEPLGKEAEAVGIFLNTLSTLFCEGESFFVDAVRFYRTELRALEGFAGSLLDRDIGAFIGHEAHHTNAHAELNSVLYSVGYKDVTRPLSIALDLVGKYPRLALHATAILEHYTATMARFILDHPDIRQLLGTEELRLWDYHAKDEWNHRCVSYDVLTRVDKHQHLTRKIAFFPVSIVFLVAVAVLYVVNGGRWNSFLFKKLLSIAPSILEYLKNDYKP